MSTICQIPMPNPVTLPVPKAAQKEAPEQAQIKYILYPGYTTGNKFLDAAALAGLYGVDLKHCLIYPYITSNWDTAKLNRLTALRPRQDGNYRLPK